MNLEIDKILEMYKRRIADLEHEAILLAVKCEMLEELNKKDNSKGEL